MIIRDLPPEKIVIGLRVRSLACDDIIGSIIKTEDVRGSKYHWVKWDNDSRIYSGFFANDCNCEIVEMKVYLDDIRDTPEGWVRTYSVNETIDLLKGRKVTHLSVDNDLGSLDHKTEGFNVLNFLEQQVFEDPTFPIPIITIHSSNEGRKVLMNLVKDKLENIRQQQINNL